MRNNSVDTRHMPPQAKRRKTTNDQQSFDELMQSIKGLQLRFNRSQRDIDARNAQRALSDARRQGATASASGREADTEAEAAVAKIAKQLRQDAMSGGRTFERLRQDAMSGGRTRKRSKVRRTRRGRQRRRASTRKVCGCTARH